ncbi:MAG: hypothetical protein LBQ12_09770 [Deltaproteobacteria bacterium]|jgi:hypothetical protein|nr:hypothetical protein [Deltaproteobacteria bacterium]
MSKNLAFSPAPARLARRTRFSEEPKLTLPRLKYSSASKAAWRSGIKPTPRKPRIVLTARPAMTEPKLRTWSGNPEFQSLSLQAKSEPTGKSLLKIKDLP